MSTQQVRRCTTTVFEQLADDTLQDTRHVGEAWNLTIIRALAATSRMRIDKNRRSSPRAFPAPIRHSLGTRKHTDMTMLTRDCFRTDPFSIRLSEKSGVRGALCTMSAQQQKLHPPRPANS